jgi:protein TonB
VRFIELLIEIGRRRCRRRAATAQARMGDPVDAGTREPARGLGGAALAAGVATAIAGCTQAPTRHWDDFQRQAALRIVAANREGTYLGEVPEPLLAIPVLEIELDRDGEVRGIRVVRRPTQAEDTVQLAIDAVRRAAPFGDMRGLTPPYKFTEVFLFDDERRFKPRTLDD